MMKRLQLAQWNSALPVRIDARALASNTRNAKNLFMHLRKCFCFGALLIGVAVSANAQQPASNKRCTHNNEILQWLAKSDFESIEKRFQNALTAYEAGQVEDHEVRSIYRGAGRASLPCHGPLFDAYVAAKPNSYPASMLRGVYLLERTYNASVNSDGSRLNDAQRKAFKQLVSETKAEFDRSITLYPRPVFSYDRLLNLSNLLRDRELANQSLAAANKVAPNNFIARQVYLVGVSPRGGGTYDNMWAFIDETRKSGVSPRTVACLERWFVDRWREDESPDDLQTIKAYADVLNGICAEPGDFYVRAGAYWRLKMFEKAAADYDSAARLEKDNKAKGTHVYWRGRAREMAGKAQEAIADYAEAEALGEVQGALVMGRLYMNGDAGVPRDPKKSLAICERLIATDTSGEAHRCLAAHYMDGIVVRQDTQKAVQHLAKSARMGNAQGNLFYGDHLWDGVGVSQDRPAAILRWCEASRANAKEGDERLMENVGFDATSATHWSCEDFSAFYASPEWRKFMNDPKWYVRNGLDRLVRRFRN